VRVSSVAWFWSYWPQKALTMSLSFLPNSQLLKTKAKAVR